MKGDPGERRRFIDELVTARWPRLAGVRADYDRVLKRRSTLAKSLSGRGLRAVSEDAAITLDIWDGQLAALGSGAGRGQAGHPPEELGRCWPPPASTSHPPTTSRRPATSPRPRCRLSRASPNSLLNWRPGCGSAVAEGMPLNLPGWSFCDDILPQALAMLTKEDCLRSEAWSMAARAATGRFALLRADRVEPVLILDDVCFAELDPDPTRAIGRSDRRRRAGADHGRGPADVGRTGGRRFRGGECHRGHARSSGEPPETAEPSNYAVPL